MMIPLLATEELYDHKYCFTSEGVCDVSGEDPKKRAPIGNKPTEEPDKLSKEHLAVYSQREMFAQFHETCRNFPFAYNE